MSFEHIKGIGLVHLNLARKPRVVPGNERHKWDKQPKRGERAVCLKCGLIQIHQHNFITIFQRPGSTEQLHQRPPCQPPTP
jgi:hypothetical protein